MTASPAVNIADVVTIATTLTSFLIFRGTNGRSPTEAAAELAEMADSCGHHALLKMTGLLLKVQTKKDREQINHMNTR